VVKNAAYNETIISTGQIETVIRKFSQDTDSEEFKWHWDEEDRIIHRVHETDWLIQLDNKLPQKIENKIKIAKGEWHRLIKGSGDLELVVEKIYK
jgi:hypothetical protein